MHIFLTRKVAHLEISQSSKTLSLYVLWTLKTAGEVGHELRPPTKAYQSPTDRQISGIPTHESDNTTSFAGTSLQLYARPGPRVYNRWQLRSNEMVS